MLSSPFHHKTFTYYAKTLTPHSMLFKDYIQVVCPLSLGPQEPRPSREGRYPHGHNLYRIFYLIFYFITTVHLSFLTSLPSLIILAPHATKLGSKIYLPSFKRGPIIQNNTNKSSIFCAFRKCKEPATRNARRI
jgi:hypothetical protein